MLSFEISPSEAAQLLKDKTARFIDVREPWELATAKIEGSVPIPMGEIPTRAAKELKADERLVIVCHHGVRSMNVTVWLRRQGFDQAQSLGGGIDTWAREMDPKVARY